MGKRIFPLKVKACFLPKLRQIKSRILQRRFPAWLSRQGGPDRFGLRRSEIPFGGGTFPEGTKVAQVLPD